VPRPGARSSICLEVSDHVVKRQLLGCYCYKGPKGDNCDVFESDRAWTPKKERVIGAQSDACTGCTSTQVAEATSICRGSAAGGEHHSSGKEDNGNPVVHQISEDEGLVESGHRILS